MFSANVKVSWMSAELRCNVKVSCPITDKPRMLSEILGANAPVGVTGGNTPVTSRKIPSAGTDLLGDPNPARLSGRLTERRFRLCKHMPDHEGCRPVARPAVFYPGDGGGPDPETAGRSQTPRAECRAAGVELQRVIMSFRRYLFRHAYNVIT